MMQLQLASLAVFALAPASLVAGQACCSHDFKTCAAWCGSTPETCHANPHTCLWLGGGSLSGSTCLPRWNGSCQDAGAEPCCPGLACVDHGHFGQCEPSDDHPTPSPTEQPCCSHDFKSCAAWCGSTPETCHANPQTCLWLGGGPLSGSTCLPRWDSTCQDVFAEPCCPGLECVDQGHSGMCLPSTVSPTEQPSIQPSVNPTPAPIQPPTPANTGVLTWWTARSIPFSALDGTSCEYGNPRVDPASNFLIPYVNTGMFCSVSADLFEGGQGCGKCYRVQYDSSDGGTDPDARSGTADIQVVESGAGGEQHFDCYDTAFEELTGVDSGIFHITYDEIPCTFSPVTIVMLHGDDADYTEVLIAGGSSGVASASITIRNRNFPMFKVSGAKWAANLRGKTNKNVSFEITLEDGWTETMNCYGGVWPVANGVICEAPAPNRQ